MKKKEMKKKLLAGVMGILMVGAMSTVAFAEEGSTTVQHTKASTYTLNIPKTVELSETAAETKATVGVSAVNTAPTEKVQVKVKSGITDGKVTLERVGDTKTTVTSAVTNSAKTALINGSVVAEFQDTSITPVGTLTGELIFAKLQDSAGGKSVKAGTYTGTMTFEGAVTVR